MSCPDSRFYGNLPKTHVDFNRSTSALPCSRQLNVWTDCFRYAAKKITRDLASIAASIELNGFSRLDQDDLIFLEGSVPAEVISISPTDAEHLNPTFAFCRSTGLEKQRVQRSIADGCYRSLQQFADPKQGVAKRMDAHTILERSAKDRQRERKLHKARQTVCSFYTRGQSPLRCPFIRANEVGAYNDKERKEVFAIFVQCCEDGTH